MGLLIDGKNDTIKKPLYQTINTADGYSISLSKNTYSTIYVSSDLSVWFLKYHYNAGGSTYNVTLSSSKSSTSVPYNVGGTMHWEAEIEEREGENDFLLKIRYYGTDTPTTIIGYKYTLVIGSEQISDVTIEGDTTINGTLNATGNVSIGTMTGGAVNIDNMTGGEVSVDNINDFITNLKITNSNITISSISNDTNNPKKVVAVSNMIPKTEVCHATKGQTDQYFVIQNFHEKFGHGLSESSDYLNQRLYLVEYYNSTNKLARFLFIYSTTYYDSVDFSTSKRTLLPLEFDKQYVGIFQIQNDTQMWFELRSDLESMGKYGSTDLYIYRLPFAFDNLMNQIQ